MIDKLRGGPLKKFSDLLPFGSAGEIEFIQDLAQKKFEEIALANGFEVITLKNHDFEKWDYILIRVAVSYSKRDLQLLDVLVEALLRKRLKMKIGLFDASRLKNMEDFKGFFPGLECVYQTPVVGFWEKGILKILKTGKDAADFLFEVCNKSSNQ